MSDEKPADICPEPRSHGTVRDEKSPLIAITTGAATGVVIIALHRLGLDISQIKETLHPAIVAGTTSKDLVEQLTNDPGQIAQLVLSATTDGGKGLAQVGSKMANGAIDHVPQGVRVQVENIIGTFKRIPRPVTEAPQKGYQRWRKGKRGMDFENAIKDGVEDAVAVVSDTGEEAVDAVTEFAGNAAENIQQLGVDVLEILVDAGDEALQKAKDIAMELVDDTTDQIIEIAGPDILRAWEEIQ